MKNVLRLVLKRPYRDVVMLGIAGWLLLLATICFFIDSTPAEVLDDLGWLNIAKDFVLLPIILGGINGGIVGLAAWACTGRSNPIVMRAVSCGLLIGAFLASVATVIFWASEHRVRFRDEVCGMLPKS